jgi:cellulose synthase operon protein C
MSRKVQLGFRSQLALLMLGSVLLTGCSSPQQRAAHHIELAEHWAARGKVNEAILEYRRAIQLQPKAPAAHLALAKIFLDRQDVPSAYQQLNNLRKNAPDNHEAQVMMADLMLETRQFREAQEQAQALTKQNPNDTEALMILTETALAMQDTELARTTNDNVLQLDAKNPRAWLVKALLQLGDKKSADSEMSLLKAIEYNPDLAPPVELLASLMAQRGDLPGAEKMTRGVLDKSQGNIEVEYLLAAILLAQNRSKDAEGVFQTIAVLGDKDPKHRGALARYYLVFGDTKAAEKEYQNILKKHPDDLQNGIDLAALYLDLGQSSDAKHIVDASVVRSPNDPQTLLLHGRLLVDDGKVEEGIQDIQHAAQLRTDWALPPYFLGLTYIQQGKLNLAEGALNQAVQLDPNFLSASLILAQLALKQGKPERAIAAVEKAVDQKTQLLQPYLLRTFALIQEGRFDEADKDTRPLLDAFPHPPERSLILRTMAWAMFHQRRYEDSHNLAKQSLLYDSTSQQSLFLLGASLIRANKPDSGLAEVAAHVRSNPQLASGYETLGQLQALAGRFHESERCFQKALQIDPTLVRSQLFLSDVQQQQGKLDQAVDTLSKLAQSQPRMSEIPISMGQIAELKEDWTAAEKYYLTALELQPGNPVAKNNLAWVYVEHGGNIDLALKLAEEAKEALPDSPAISDTLAWILVKKQSYAMAISLLQEAVRKEPENATFNYHLGVAYYRAGEKPEAERSLRSALKAQPTFSYAGDAKQILAVLSN